MIQYVQSFNEVISFTKRFHIKGTCTNGRITSTSIAIHHFQDQGIIDIVNQDKEGFIKLGVLVVLNVLCTSNFSIVGIANVKSDVRIQGTKEIIVPETIGRVNFNNQDTIGRVYTWLLVHKKNANRPFYTLTQISCTRHHTSNIQSKHIGCIHHGAQGGVHLLLDKRLEAGNLHTTHLVYISTAHQKQQLLTLLISKPKVSPPTGLRA